MRQDTGEILEDTVENLKGVLDKLKKDGVPVTELTEEEAGELRQMDDMSQRSAMLAWKRVSKTIPETQRVWAKKYFMQGFNSAKDIFVYGK